MQHLEIANLLVELDSQERYRIRLARLEVLCISSLRWADKEEEDDVPEFLLTFESPKLHTVCLGEFGLNLENKCQIGNLFVSFTQAT